jgi:3-hydroxyisobutyrate dehydrogenase-like beta-hydroxyacid dehydrogenase
MRVGFIGLGRTGMGMAANLRGPGEPVSAEPGSPEFTA